jgi:hypothetical protein
VTTIFSNMAVSVDGFITGRDPPAREEAECRN